MSVRLFVGNLAYTTQEADIREHFAAVGPVSQVVIPVDRETGRMRGFAFVDVDDPAVAEAAIRILSGKPLNGRSLVISEARPRGDRSGPRGVQPDTGISPASATAPATEDRGRRSFGPDKPPRRRGGPQHRHASERAKGPLRQRAGGRVFDIDEDPRTVSTDLDDVAAGVTPGGQSNEGDE